MVFDEEYLITFKIIKFISRYKKKPKNDSKKVKYVLELENPFCER